MSYDKIDEVGKSGSGGSKALQAWKEQIANRASQGGSCKHQTQNTETES